MLRRSTPPIVDELGRSVPGSVARLERVRLGGVQQWLVLRGHRQDGPILLFLAGGPGGSEIGWVRTFNGELEHSFVVVNWDQRGAGKSYRLLTRRSSLRPERYVDDAVDLAERLHVMFPGQPLHLIGHSWGAVLGILAAQRRPDLFASFVGVGTVVAVAENDRVSWEWTRARAEEAAQARTVTRLVRNGPPPYSGLRAGLKYHAISGGAEQFNDYPSNPYRQHSTATALHIPEYSHLDWLRVLLGFNRGTATTYQGILDLDLRRDVPDLAIPAYFAHGRHDIHAWGYLAEDYVTSLRAPHKELIWFADSGHSPCFEEPAKFRELMLRVRAG